MDSLRLPRLLIIMYPRLENEAGIRGEGGGTGGAVEAVAAVIDEVAPILPPPAAEGLVRKPPPFAHSRIPSSMIFFCNCDARSLHAITTALNELEIFQFLKKKISEKIKGNAKKIFLCSWVCNTTVFGDLEPKNVGQ